MSVINQMLKDLEQRAPEANTHHVPNVMTEQVHSGKKIAIITAVCVLSLCLIGFYIWQLISENNALKAEQTINAEAMTTSVKKFPVQKTPIKATSDIEISGETSTLTSQVPSPEIKANASPQPKQAKTESLEEQEVSRSDKAPISALSINNVQKVASKPVKENEVTKVTPADKNIHIPSDHSHAANFSGHKHKAVSKVNANTNKMSVSRRQLSADELVAQKLMLAEKALNSNNTAKAEKLLEDVVILKPDDSQTRKKLAALWFGRQAYQDATNILSQGIALNSRDSSLRELKARIHLQQGQVTTALNTLKPLASLKDEQYQIMLANIGQQAKQNDVAINAYLTLIAMQPEIGRWHLALAVLYDKNSQFNLASVSYKKALTKNDLSVSSEKFAKQRIQVIGQ